jgi:hypothetical protein
MQQTTTNNEEGSMKIQKAVRIAVVCLVGIGIPLIGQCQTYTLSTPISGSLTMSAEDLNTGNSGGVYFNFSTLSETVYINPVAATIEQWGTINGTLSAPNFSFQDVQQFGTFPSPITSVTGAVTVALAPPLGGISFDTGPQPISLGSGAYSFSGNLPMTLGGMFSGSYSVVTGGQTYNGLFSYQLNENELTIYYPPNTFDTVSTAGYPNSIALSGLSQTGPGGFSASPNPVSTVTAADGLQVELHVGAFSTSGSSEVELFNWASPGTITATELVPEPTTLSLLAFGMCGIIVLLRHRR